MRRILLVAMSAGLALVLTGCFAMQGFVLLASSIVAGDKTKAQFTLRPFEAAENRNFQFVVVGVPTGGDLAVGKAIWGANGKFGGPVGMPVFPGMGATLASSGQCDSNGLDFAAITGTKWKAFMTSSKVNDHGNVAQPSIVNVTVRAKSTAGTDTNYKVFGVTGVWIDDGDDIVEAGDTWYCTGIASTALYVPA